MHQSIRHSHSVAPVPLPCARMSHIMRGSTRSVRRTVSFSGRRSVLTALVYSRVVPAMRGLSMARDESSFVGLVAMRCEGLWLCDGQHNDVVGE